MRKLILTVTALASLSVLYAAPGDTTRLRVHDAVDMVWYENYDRPVTFPDEGVTYSKILMHYTMGCASTGCSDWDYTTKIELRKPLGYNDSTIADITIISEDPYDADTTWDVFEAKESFELARVITPYGGYMRTGANGYNSGWKHIHTFDVTDYAPLFQGDTEIRAFYGGWSSGFSVTVDFEFIEGTPPREVKEVRNLWQTGGDGWNYQSHTHFEQNHAVPMDVDFPGDINGAKVRFIPSGHGFDNNTACAEFCERNYYLKLDGTQFGSENMWDDKCGENPIFPQGGTWLYDRANWCPGLRAHHFDHEITNLIQAGSTHELDLDIQQINWSGTQAPVYILETQLFLYGDHNFQTDAAIEDIIAPTNKDDYKRFNPICNHARVVIKNYGKLPLTQATIRYAVNGNNWREFQWQGNLAFDESEEVQLPLTESWEWVSQNGVNQFEVEIITPNGGSDENELNNGMVSEFETTPMLPGNLEFQLRTNTKPYETTWKLYDGYGNVLRENQPGMVANTIYRDTFDLQEGCYILRIEDSAENGLSWWANNDGSGYARLRIPGAQMAHTFQSDFGSHIEYYFTVGYTLNTPDDFLKVSPEVQVYPNPSEGLITVELGDFSESEVTVEITDAFGRTIYNEQVSIDFGSQVTKKVYDLSSSSSGNYFVHITSGLYRKTSKVIVY